VKSLAYRTYDESLQKHFWSRPMNLIWMMNMHKVFVMQNKFSLFFYQVYFWIFLVISGMRCLLFV